MYIDNFNNKISDYKILAESKAITFGDLDYAKKTDTKGMMGGRGTGHFGTGFYFVGKDGPYGISQDGKIKYDYEPTRPIYEIDLDAYKLFKPKDNDTAYRLHDAFREINNYYWSTLDKFLFKTLDVDDLKEKLFQVGWIADDYDLSEDLDDDLDDLDFDDIDFDLDSNMVIQPDDELSDAEKDKVYEDNYRKLAVEFIKNNSLEDFVRTGYISNIEDWIKDKKPGEIEKAIEQAIDDLDSYKHYVEYGINTVADILGTNKNKILEIIKKSDQDRENTISTQIMKALGYDGVDVTHLNHDAQGLSGLDNFSYGTVIYDLKPGTFKKIAAPRKNESMQQKLTRDEIEAEVAEKLGTSISPIEGPSYILKDGSFLKVWDSDIDIRGMSGSQSKSGKTMHLDIDGFISKEIDPTAYSYYYLNDDCIRVNTGFEEYIVLPKKRPNEQQFDSLLEWLNFYFFDMKHDRLKVLDWYGSYANSKEYYLDTTMPEEIIKKIKEYYGTGELREKIVKLSNGKWQVQSEKGKNLGTYNTKPEAEDRLKDVEMFKHMNEANNEQTVSILTYQNPNVLKHIKEGNTYIASYDRGMFQDYGEYNPYKELARVLEIKNCPIFGALNEEELRSMLDASGIDYDESGIIKLEVPVSEVHYMGFYDWTDYIYALEEPEQFEEESGMSIKDLEDQLKDYHNEGYCQVVIDRIEPEWLDSQEIINEDYYNDLDISKALENKEEVLKILKDRFGITGVPKTGGYYILPDGSCVQSKDHLDIDKYLINQGYITTKQKSLDYSDGSQFLDTLNSIRIRRRGGSDTWLLPYVVLPKGRPTEAQYSTLLSWLDFVLGASGQVMIEPNEKGYNNSKVYRNSHNEMIITDDIIEDIKKYYATGKLPE